MRSGNVALRRLAWLGCVAALAPVALRAGDWRVTPRVTLSETWSDNIRQAPARAERHDLVTQASAGVGIAGSGRRLQLNFDYQPTLVRYARRTSGSRVDHRLQGSGNAELYEDHLFLDFAATVSQQNVSNQGPLARDTVSVSNNRETVVAMRASPYWRQRIGRYADGILRYEGGVLENETSSDTTSDELSLSLSSGAAFPRLPWTLSASYRREENRRGRTVSGVPATGRAAGRTRSTFRNVDGSVRYQFTRQYGVRLRAGYQSDDTFSTRRDDSGATWGVTGIWTPGERTSIEAGMRQQPFGNSIVLDARHRMRKAVFDASFREERTTTSQRRLQRQLFPLTDAFGQPIENPGLQDVPVPINDPTFTNETFISQRFSGGVSLQGRRTSGRTSLYHEKRSFELSGGDETVTGFDASVSRTLSRLSSATVRGYYQVSQFTTRAEDSLYGVSVSYSRTLYRDLSASVTYSHARNDSATPANDYTENRVAASVTMLF